MNRRRHPLIPAAQRVVQPAVLIVQVQPIRIVLIRPGNVLLLRHAPTRPPVDAHRSPLPLVNVQDRTGQLGVDETALAGQAGLGVLVAGDVEPAHQAEKIAVMPCLPQHILPSPGGDRAVAHPPLFVPHAQRLVEVLLQRGGHHLVIVAADSVGEVADVVEEADQPGRGIIPLLRLEPLYQVRRVEDIAVEHIDFVLPVEGERAGYKFAQPLFVFLPVDFEPAGGDMGIEVI